ncbi:MAG: M48 family metallopeptidase [Bacillota bacterium]
MELVYGKERPLFIIVFLLSLIVWLPLIGITIFSFGIFLIYPLIFFLFYLFTHSVFISHLRGTGVRITKEQFPDLHERIESACKKLEMRSVPEAYLINSNGVLNALATRFLGRNMLVLYADIVNALDDRPDAVSFYIGHELGHIKRNHLLMTPVLFPGRIWPLVGFAYGRAKEYTCDLHGLACCPNLEDAQRALVVLAAGKRRWKTLNLAAYGQQIGDTGGFWMSFNEITSDYPWLVKRLEHVTAVSQNRDYKYPTRNFFAWVVGLLVPRAGATGMAGGIVQLYIVIAIIGILAAIAIPAYQDYIARSQMSEAIQIAGGLEQPLAEFYQKNQSWPNGLADSFPKSNVGKYADTVTLVGAHEQVIGILVTMKTSGVNANIAGKTLEIWTVDGGSSWQCGPGDSDPVAVKYLPANCRDEGAP